jgi:hypothetical protein
MKQPRLLAGISTLSVTIAHGPLQSGSMPVRTTPRDFQTMT